MTLNELEKLRDVSGIEGRFETGHVNLSVFRFDDEMIVTPILALKSRARFSDGCGSF